jgi:hypothetical protein
LNNDAGSSSLKLKQQNASHIDAAALAGEEVMANGNKEQVSDVAFFKGIIDESNVDIAQWTLPERLQILKRPKTVHPPHCQYPVMELEEYPSKSVSINSSTTTPVWRSWKTKFNKLNGLVFLKFPEEDDEAAFRCYATSKLRHYVLLLFVIGLIGSLISCISNLNSAQFSIPEYKRMEAVLSGMYIAFLTVTYFWRGSALVLEIVVIVMVTLLFSFLAFWDIYLQVTYPNNVFAHEVIRSLNAFFYTLWVLHWIGIGRECLGMGA